MLIWQSNKSWVAHVSIINALTFDGMSGGSRVTARNRTKPRAGDGDSSTNNQGATVGRGRGKSRDHGPLHIMDVKVRTLLGIVFSFLALFLVSFLLYNRQARTEEDVEFGKLKRVVTPLPAPRMLDLPQVRKFDWKWRKVMKLLVISCCSSESFDF